MHHLQWAYDPVCSAAEQSRRMSQGSMSKVYHNQAAWDNGWRIPECTAAFDFIAKCRSRSRKRVPAGVDGIFHFTLNSYSCHEDMSAAVWG
jgi:hypothetical protein